MYYFAILGYYFAIHVLICNPWVLFCYPCTILQSLYYFANHVLFCYPFTILLSIYNFAIHLQFCYPFTILISIYNFDIHLQYCYFAFLQFPVLPTLSPVHFYYLRCPKRGWIDLSSSEMKPPSIFSMDSRWIEATSKENTLWMASHQCDQIGPMLWFLKYFRRKIQQKIGVFDSKPS
jgi:hypothetical protein